MQYAKEPQLSRRLLKWSIMHCNHFTRRSFKDLCSAISACNGYALRSLRTNRSLLRVTMSKWLCTTHITHEIMPSVWARRMRDFYLWMDSMQSIRRVSAIWLWNVLFCIEFGMRFKSHCHLIVNRFSLRECEVDCVLRHDYFAGLWPHAREVWVALWLDD